MVGLARSLFSVTVIQGWPWLKKRLNALFAIFAADAGVFESASARLG
jgi:hypothetical protein